MNKKDKDEMVKMIAEAINTLIVPQLDEVLDNQKDQGEDLEVIKRTSIRIEDKQDRQDKKISDNTERIEKLETKIVSM